MNAVQVTDYGGPEVLRVTKLPDPTPGPGQILVQVEACGVCYHDLLTRRGFITRGIELPIVPGHEVAGRILAKGTGVTELRVGDRVCSVPLEACWRCRYCLSGRDNICASARMLGHGAEGGGYAELMVADSRLWAKVPEGIAPREAAVLGCAIGTVYHAFREGRVRTGEVVLITGAGGGTGLHSVQMARLTGAHVLAVTTSEQKVDAIRAAGADEVILAPDGCFHVQVQRLTGGMGAEVIMDNVGTPVWASTVRSIAPGGRIVFIGQVSGDTVPFNPGTLVLRGIHAIGTRGATVQELHEVMDLVQAGKITPVVSAELPLAEAAAAHRLMGDRQTIGRIVLCP